MQGRNWKLAMLLAATVGAMSSAAIAQSNSTLPQSARDPDVARQQPQGLRDADVERQKPQGLRDADVERQKPQGLRDAEVERQKPQGLRDGEQAPPAK
jgi:hypothetical protein